jgi:hypothetical protein
MKWLFIALVVAGCASDSLAGIGQACNSSGDCAAGLLCDFGMKNHTCQPAGTIHPPDLSMSLDLSGDDLSGIDLATTSHD